MKNITVKNLIAAGIALVAFTACYDDEGNYSYSEVPVITAENFPEALTAIQKVDTVVINPKIISSKEGEIKEDNPNFEFNCYVQTESGTFSDGTRKHDINPEHKKEVKYVMKENQGTYLIWYTVTDKRSGVTTNFYTKVEVTSSTYKGWLVLCDEGDENRVRLDLYSNLGNGREALVPDVMGPSAPVRHNANRVSMYDYYTSYQSILVSSKEGASYLDINTLATDETLDAIYQFIVPPTDETIVLAQTHGYYVNDMITDKGNLYSKGYSYGSSFESPINTLTAYGAPEFQVAPMVGSVPGSVAGVYMIVYYDITNGRYVARYIYAQPSKLDLLPETSQPDPAISGKKLITMQGCWFSNGTVYSVHENEAGERSVLGLGVGGAVYNAASIAKSYEKKITADGFNKAKFYAFHSQYPYCFYEVGNEIKSLNLMTESLSSALNVPSNEEITMVKCNLLVKDFSSTDPDLAATDYALMIGSYDKSDPVKGGVLRMYTVGTDGSLTLLKEYKGFAKIKDVIYRER